MVKHDTVDAYFSTLAPEHQALLHALRKLLLELMVETTERIYYGVPSVFEAGKPMIGYAATKSGYSIYPMSGSVFEQLAEDLQAYKTTKGAINFKFSDGLPTELIAKIVDTKRQEVATKQV